MSEGIDVAALDLQRICALDWAAPEVEVQGALRLRAAGGFTRRANSALVTTGPPWPDERALAAMDAWYDERGLPARVQVVEPEQAELTAYLRERGWRVVVGALVMVADLDRVLHASGDQPDRLMAGLEVEDRPEPDAAWLDHLVGLRGDEGASPGPAAMAVLRSGGARFVSAHDRDGCSVGALRMTVTEGWLSITSMHVAPAWRRRGVGRGLLAATGVLARDAGARWAVLQVVPDNVAAIALYTDLGFTVHHRYTYLEGPARQSEAAGS